MFGYRLRVSMALNYQTKELHIVKIVDDELNFYFSFHFIFYF